MIIFTTFSDFNSSPKNILTLISATTSPQRQLNKRNFPFYISTTGKVSRRASDPEMGLPSRGLARCVWNSLSRGTPIFRSNFLILSFRLKINSTNFISGLNCISKFVGRTRVRMNSQNPLGSNRIEVSNPAKDHLQFKSSYPMEFFTEQCVITDFLSKSSFRVIEQGWSSNLVN